MIRNILIPFFRSYGYHSFLMLGALSMFLLLLLRRRQYGLSKVKAMLFCGLLLGCGIAGAKLLYFLESGGSSFSGMSFFGSVFLVPIAMPLIGNIMGIDAGKVPDLCAPCVASIISFMRFGCFCGGCCGGTYSSSGFRWPTQLMEGFGDLLILFGLLYVEGKGKQGTLYPIFLVGYGVLRFFVEFLRDTSKNIFGFSNGQLFAIAAVIVGILFLLRIHISEVSNNGKKTA